MSRRHKKRKKQHKPPKQPKPAVFSRRKRDSLSGAPFTASISTSAGNVLIHSTKEVYIALDNGKYLKKPVRELKPGETVVFEKQGIDLVLKKDVEPILLQSPRYRATVPELYATLDGGVHSTRFSRELWKGIEEDAAHEMAVREAKRSESRAEAAASIIETMLRIHGITRSMPHIRDNWLGGSVVAPNSYANVFAALGKEMPSTEFSSLAESAQFADSYRLHMALRKGVMRAITLAIKGAGNGSAGPSGGNGKHEDIRPEIRLVAEHFAEEIDEAHAKVRVFEIRKMHSNEGNGKGEGTLYRGLLARPSPRFEGSLQDVPDLLGAFNALQIMARRVCDECLLNFSGEFPVWEEYRAQRISRSRISAFVVDYVPERMGYGPFTDRSGAMRKKAEGRGIDASADADYKDTVREFLSRIREGIAPQMLREIEGGRLDRHYGLPHGMVHGLFERYCKAGIALPEMVSYGHYLDYLGKCRIDAYILKVDRGELPAPRISRPAFIRMIFGKDLGREMDKVHRKLLGRYGERILSKWGKSPLEAAAENLANRDEPAQWIRVDSLLGEYYSGRISFSGLVSEMSRLVHDYGKFRSATDHEWRGKVLSLLGREGLMQYAFLIPGLVDG